MKMSQISDAATIYALSSAPGRAGIAVVRLSGPQTGKVLHLMASPRPKPRMAAARAIRHPQTGEVLDRGLVLWFPGPKSFTGEDAGELLIHGGRAVVAAILAAIASVPGCRLAEPGEFARRAFDSGKLDLTEVEGLADLIAAETEAQRRQALRQATGELAGLVESWRSELLEALSLLESAIDFSDEAEVSDQCAAEARVRVVSLANRLARFLDDGQRGEIVRDGFRVVLAGPPNVGKSSLLNALARRPAAIVSEEAGTTRDVIEVHLDLEGFPVIVSDTAGLRSTDQSVEQEGIRRTLQTAAEADLVLWLVDPYAPVLTLPRDLAAVADHVLVVLTKSDLLAGGAPSILPDDGVVISSKTGEGLADLSGRIAAIARDSLASGESLGPVLTNARQRGHAAAAHRALLTFLQSPLELTELRAEDLRQAANALERFTGRIDVEDVLDGIFSRFCIGK